MNGIFLPLATEFYRQAGEYVKTALYSCFLLNGGAATAIIAKQANHSIPASIFSFLFGLLCAIGSVIAAFFAANEAARFFIVVAGETVDPPFSKKALSLSMKIAGTFGLISLISFLVGCVWTWSALRPR